jgi:hypothetical protein
MSTVVKVFRHLLNLAADHDTCQALDQDAKRCHKRARWRDAYHGDPEAYNFFNGRPQWVLVKLCDDHDLERVRSVQEAARV